MKRILIFSLAYYPKFVGGAEVAIKEITDRLDPAAFEFHMVTLRFDSSFPQVEKVGRVLVHRVGYGKKGAETGESYGPLYTLTKIAFIPLAALKALSLHRRHRYDGAWAMMTYMLFPVVLMRLAFVRVPYALTVQEGDPFARVFKRLRIMPFLPLLRYGFRHAAAVSAISTFLGTWAKQFGFEGAVAHVPNGVDLALFSGASAEARGAIRKELGLSDADTALVTVSRLVQKNGVDLIIAALPLLPSTAHLVILGAGPDESALRALAKKLQVERRVHMLGQKPYRELPRYLKAADLFVRPSRSEGMGNAFIEAMAARLPVIGTREGGIADFLFDERKNPGREPTGWVVDRDNPAQIAEAVKDIASSPAKRERIIAHAFDVSRSYDWEFIASKMCDEVFAKLH